ncbi:MAG: FixH family protein [Verrucomicrobiota bacterium]
MNAIRRNPWPYAIIGYFVVFISCMAAWIAFAMRQDMDLVRKDYYEEEIRYQQQLDRMNRTQLLKAEVKVAFDFAVQRISVQLPATHADAKGRIHLYRPSDAKLDRQFDLAVGGDGLQTLDAKELQAGLWKLRVTWASGGQEYHFEQPLVIGAN